MMKMMTVDRAPALGHHNVFSHFKPFSGEVPAFRQVDFIGTTIRQEFQCSIACHAVPITMVDWYPLFDEEYFEWIDLLESVVDARDSYTMIELGARLWTMGRSRRARRAAVRFKTALPPHRGRGGTEGFRVDARSL